MSDVIQLLPDSVANQIAAGEVIQRPASVIKELVENSVDAGAKTIKVLIVDAGRTTIQVVDDGRGMSETDARLAFERHATSKIRKAEDLFNLHSMGFRGEALPSIAAVAQVELLTRQEGEDVGTRLTLHGSRIVNQEPVACPVGCNFKVDNLFFNVPARRKFLKTNATELNNILVAFERIVLVYPEITFQLYSNGQDLLNLKAGSIRQRIADLFGKKMSQGLLPIDVETTMCKISGFVGKPETARKRGGGDYFFVNGRFMRHPYFHKAVIGAFERLIPTGAQIPYFIYFEVDPSEIDVNIHPTKTEIKFENEQPIWQVLSAAVKDAIGKFCDVPSIEFDIEGRPDIPVFDPNRDHVEMPKVNYNSQYNPFKEQKPVDNNWQQLYEQALGKAEQKPTHVPLFDDEMTLMGNTQEQVISEKSPIHYQYKGRYIMTAVKSGLMIIDQHRADLRIHYERILKQLNGQQVSSQRVLFPELLRLSPSENAIMQKIMPNLMAIGFDLSDLGGGSYSLAAIPSDFEGLDPVRLLENIVSDAVEAGEMKMLEEVQKSIALNLARHAAITQGQVLSNEEMERLINELFSCSNVNYTPDGHAILYILPQQDLERFLG